MQSFSVFFKVESDIHSTGDMEGFGQKCISQSSSAKILSSCKNDNSVQFTVSFENYDDAEMFIHNNNYMRHENGFNTLALWNGKKPRFEVFVSDGPKGLTRRSLFLAMEKFGEIGKVTVSKSTEGAGWVSFLNQNSYKSVLAAIVFVCGKKVKVMMTDGTIDNLPCETKRKTISFNSFIRA